MSSEEIDKSIQNENYSASYNEAKIVMHERFAGNKDLVDIRTVKLRDGASRIENALYFLEQIKNPHKFRVGNDVVEICFAGEESLSVVLAKHFNRKM